MAFATRSRSAVLVAALVGACTDPLRFPMRDTSPGDATDLDGRADAQDIAVPDVAPRDVPQPDVQLEPDAACATSTARATVTRLPVDIIWVVDNSVSMAPAIREVTRGLNAFADRVGSRGLDHRVVMLSWRSATNPVTVHGGTRFGVCIPRPLAGDDACGNGPRFFQSSVDVLSTQPLEQLLGTLAQTSGYQNGQTRGGEPWRDFLRADATKTLVVVTDDNSRMGADSFEHFGGGTNPMSTSLTLPPGLLEPTWAGLFTGYTFNALYGWDTDASDTARCHYADGTQPPSAGPVYTTLVARTRGARARICDGSAAWTTFFDAVATAVERTSRLACDVPIPDPGPGETLDPRRVNVVLEGTGTSTRVGKVANAAACGASGGWYYDNDAAPTRIFLCPTSCDRAQELVRAGAGAVQVQFGCESIPG